MIKNEKEKIKTLRVYDKKALKELEIMRYARSILRFPN